jgi:hypothetical protein
VLPRDRDPVLVTSSRLIRPSSVLTWVMLVGLVVTVPALGIVPAPTDVDTAGIGWLAVAGGGNVAGLLLAYSALRVGKVGIIAPILSTEGGVGREPLRHGAPERVATVAVGLLPARLIGVFAVTLPLLATGRLGVNPPCRAAGGPRRAV